MSAPVFLPPGSRLGIFSPSGANKLFLAPSLRILRSAGYAADPVPKAAKPCRGYLAGTDRERLESLARLWRKPAVDAYLARRGGYGAQRLLPALGDWSEAPRGKPIIGFSDLTALHLARYKLAGEGGWHAVMAEGLQKLDETELKANFEALAGKGPRRWAFPKESVLGGGGSPPAIGPILGGNLTIICALLGSGRLPSFSGAILMLEDVGEKGYRLDRLLSTLSLSSAAQGALGVVFGDFARCGSKRLVRALLKEFSSRFQAPAVMDAPFGHCPRNRPWWVGEISELSVDSDGMGSLTFLGR